MILVCFGTRPEWLKIKPVLDLLDRGEYKLLFTGQHTSLVDSVDFDYTIYVGTSADRLNQVIADCLSQFPPTEGVKAILVQGDTASAYGCALAGFNRRIPVVHLEAGLRSFSLDHPYPEEGYRQMISRIATVNLAPTDLSKTNLTLEGVLGSNVVVGNTVLDNLVNRNFKPTYQNKVLVTLHRRENHFMIKQWFSEIEKLAQRYPDLEFILPIHPNPNVHAHKGLLTKVKVVEPLPHEELLSILANCRLVISDSGGIQEEASFLGKKVIVCRNFTERPEGIGSGHLHMCTSPDLIGGMFDSLINDYKINTPCPYGDGHSAPRVVERLRLLVFEQQYPNW